MRTDFPPSVAGVGAAPAAIRGGVLHNERWRNASTRSLATCGDVSEFRDDCAWDATGENKLGVVKAYTGVAA